MTSLRRLAAALCVSLACALTAAAEPMPDSARDDVFDFLAGVNTAGDGIDALSRGLLSDPGMTLTIADIDPATLDARAPRFRVSWWELFGELLVAEKVLGDLGRGDIEGAMVTASVHANKKLLQSTALGASVLRDAQIAGIGTLLLEWYLDEYAALVDRVGFRNQLRLYTAARAEIDHAAILAGADTPTVKFTSLFTPEPRDRYISRVIGLDFNPWIARPNARIDRDQFFEIARLIHDNAALQDRVLDRRRAVIRAYIESLPAPGRLPEDTPVAGPGPLDGLWSGFSRAGSQVLDYRIELAHLGGDALQGVISLKRRSADDWTRYSVSGRFDGDRLQLRGTGWLTADTAGFCMVEARLDFLPGPGGDRLAGTWGPLAAPGGCPPGSSGRTEVTRGTTGPADAAGSDTAPFEEAVARLQGLWRTPHDTAMTVDIAGTTGTIIAGGHGNRPDGTDLLVIEARAPDGALSGRMRFSTGTFVRVEMVPAPGTLDFSGAGFRWRWIRAE